jgi:cytoskeleton protein RodZ
VTKKRDAKLADQEDAAKASLGERLRQARELKKLSLEDVAKHLHLGVEKIEALERDEVEQIAAPVFVAGYLRAYARLLGLSGDEIVSIFEGSLGTSSSGFSSNAEANNYGKVQFDLSDKVLLGGNSHWKLITLLILLGVVLPTISFFIWNDDDDVASVEKIAKVSVEMPVEITEPISELTPDPTSNEEWESKGLTIDEQTESVAIVTEASDVEANDVESENVEAQFADVILATTVEDALPQSELALYFSEDSWVEVHDARGQRLVYQLGQTGMVRTVMGVAPFEVQLGYVPGVNIIYNGESYDLSRFEGKRQARFRVGSLGDHINNG